jgi:hypothetical protein
MSKFGGWLAGLLAAIISGYAVWYLTKTPSTPATTTFEGMVYSESSPVPNAIVLVSLKDGGVKNGPYRNATDEHGAYRIDFTGLSATTSATVRATANGFRDSATQSLPSLSGTDNRHDIPLVALALPEAPAPGAAAHPTIAPHIPIYVRRPAEQALQVKLK